MLSIFGVNLKQRFTIKQTAIVETKYIATNNIVVHTENCKLEISLECTVQ